MTRSVLNCGYVALVDSAPLIIARELEFAAEEGIELNLVRQPSWSALRDMLALGHLDAAQMLSPMPVAMSLGLGSLPAQIDALMVLSVNGTVFGVSNDLATLLGDLPFGDPLTARKALLQLDDKPLRVGVPFGYSMHRLLLSYWALTDPNLRIEAVTVPPPQMANAVADGHVDAFWVGEPWGTVAVERGIAQLVLTGRDIWSFAPEKVLAARRDWITDHPKEASGLMRAVFKAANWLDTNRNKPLAVEILSRSEHLDLPHELIDPALTGFVTPKIGDAPVRIEKFLQFHKFAANFPWRSQAAWIARQLGADADGMAEARRVFRPDLYRQNLQTIGADCPGASEKIEGSLRFETAVASTRGHMILAPDAFFDGKTFDFS